MPKSYTKMLQKQLKPQATSLMGKFVKNLEEKLKDPNSIESKTLLTLIVLVAGKQLAEKLVAQALAFVHHAQEQLAKSPRQHSAANASGAENSAREETDESTRYEEMRKLLTSAESQLGFLAEKRVQLINLHQEKLQNLKDIYNPQFQQAIKENLPIPVSDNQIKEISDLYQERAEKRQEIIATAKKVGAAPELFASEDPKAQARINANVDVGTQVILAGLLRQAVQASNQANPAAAPISMKSLLNAVNNIHGATQDIASLYGQVVTAVKEDHQKVLADIQNAESPLRQLASALSQQLNIAPTLSTPSPSSTASNKQQTTEEDVNKSTAPSPSPLNTTLKGH